MSFSDFHFIRPYWFIAILPIAYVLWKLAKQHLVNRHWESVCDPELLPYILIGKSGTKKNSTIILTGLVALLMVLALAGPTWERLPQPVFEKESALVIAFDLSLSMYADDIKPSRLERARFKVSDLLNSRKEGQTALLVYAGDAFTVTPLTDDIKTINSQLSALSPAIMPAQGSRTDIAVNKAVELLKQAGNRQGHILFVTDEIEIQYENNIIQANKEGYTISILAIGTAEGAPVSLGDSGFLEDRAGTIVVPKLDEKVLRQLASAGGGYYVTSQIVDTDIERLNTLFNSELDSKLNSKEETEFKSDQWHEFGPWLVLLILPFVAFGFRRGYLAICVCIIMTGHPGDAMAFEWRDLWLNKNQQAMQALENEQTDVASELFQDNEWKAVAKYRSGDYAATEELLNDLQDNRNLYNKANSLVKQGRYEEAIEAYKQVLENEPEHEDAKYNKELVEKELEKQQQSDSDQNQQQNQQENKQNQSEQDQQQSQPDNKQESDSESEQQQSESENQQSQNNNEQQDNNKNAEQQQSEKDEQQKQQEQEQKQQQTEKNDDQQSDAESEQQSQQTSNEIDEEQQAAEQWLRRIPDDPSGLLRRKFKYQYQQQQNRQSATNEKYW